MLRMQDFALEFYSQFVQHWKIYRVNSLIWHTLHKLNVLWTEYGFLELLSGHRHKATSHSTGIFVNRSGRNEQSL
jgi:hypothetical protein